MNEKQIENLMPVVYQTYAVVTTEQLANFYECSVTQIKQNFNNNKAHFVEGRHFFKLEGEELKLFKNKVENFDLVGKNANILYLWTKRGAARHAKMLGTEKAWDVFELLESAYFDKQNPQNLTGFALIKMLAEKGEEHERQLQALRAGLHNETVERVKDYGHILERTRQIENYVVDNSLDIGRLLGEFESLSRKIDTMTAPDFKDQMNVFVKDILIPYLKITEEGFADLEVGEQIKVAYSRFYSQIERVGLVRLNQRLKAKKRRMELAGAKKTDIKKTTNLDVICEEQAIRQVAANVIITFCSLYRSAVEDQQLLEEGSDNSETD